MAQIRNISDIRNSIEDDAVVAVRKLPNFFDADDCLKTPFGIGASVGLHIAFACLVVILSQLGFVFPRFAPPELPNRDIEFKLVEAPEKPPIDKNTKIRSDRNSQAGGIHDPKRPVAEPAPKAASAPKSSAPKAQPAAPKAPVQKQPQKTQPKVVQQPQKVQPKVQPKVAQAPQVPQVPKAPAKPAPAKAPSAAKPSVVKPNTAQGVAKPSAPKVATAPKSPFAVPVPSSGAPTGTTYRPQGTPQAGGTSGSGGRAGGTGAGAPSPKFSSSGGTGGTSGSGGGRGTMGTGSYGARGQGGYGTGGNPSPGNPNGTPGIDAIKQPNWGPYMRDLEARIKRNWAPPKGDSSKRVVITFTIARDGRLLTHKITKSSGVPLADRAAMAAIEQTAPFRPLPPEFKGTSVPIEFTFDYNVLNSVLK